VLSRGNSIAPTGLKTPVSVTTVSQPATITQAANAIIAKGAMLFLAIFSSLWLGKTSQKSDFSTKSKAYKIRWYWNFPT
jgi:hypothetical protein